MNIFNSLGSNYDFNFVLKSLLTFSGDSKQLENILEEKYGGKAILVYKGREAIELALKALDLPKDSFVAINGFTCFAVYEAIKSAELGVEYVDIERGELNFSAEELEKHLKENPKIKVVIVQNTLGYPCDIENISKICQDNHLTLIEDLAHCVGTKYLSGLEAGEIGNLVILSFSQDKIVDGISGGALITKTDSSVHLLGRLAHDRGVRIKKQLVDRLYPVFTYLIRTTYPTGLGKILHKLLKGLKLLSGPMDQQDGGIHQLPNWYANLAFKAFSNLPDNLSHRRKIASIYAKQINPKITSPKIIDTINLSSNLRFPIFVNKREQLVKYLKQSGIYISDIWYDSPLDPKQCPNAELASDEILNLPTHINVSEKDAENISNLLNQWLKLQ